MADNNQLSFGDGLLSGRSKTSKLSKHLQQLDQIVDWHPLVEAISVIDKTSSKTGGRPRKNPLWMLKATFLQGLFSLSDPQLEDQLIDRLSFQRFVGINLDQEIPDFTTFWRFKEALSSHNLDKKIFELINDQLEDRGLMIKKGTIVDATILPSANRPLSEEKRRELQEESTSQIDTDAKATKKGGRYYFGYKGHIGVDIESKLIRKATFTPAHRHDSTQTKKLISYDEKSLFGDKAYFNGDHQFSARHYGWYYGVLGKAKRGQPLSSSQKKRNRKLSRVRSAVEHPFAWMKTKANLVALRAKTKARNRLRFTFACVGWNLSRAEFLIRKSRSVGSVAL
ncbi:MAG TPA: IS5 family transposase [Fodinibius sp.]|nr:IS5 family transposase [Fodinibius sp.]